MRVETLDLSFFGIPNNCYIFRDDLFPFYYGGNKARKLIFELENIKKNNFSAVVTTGSIFSNHCRAVAVACAENKIACTLVLHRDERKKESESSNEKILKRLPANLVYTSPENISMQMDAAINTYNNLGYKAYYLSGGGHTLHGTLAYIEATKSLLINNKNLKNLRHIFVTCGTGSTLAGIAAAIEELKLEGDIKVLGVSIARNIEKASNAVKVCLEWVSANSTIDRLSTIINDNYLMGGYGKSTPELDLFLTEVIKKTGIIFDNTYTGKSLFGMVDIIKKQNLSGDILFWHTGGNNNI